MNASILYRLWDGNEEELEILQRHFDVYHNRSNINCHNLIIPRYSALPFFKELEYDVNKFGSKLINTYSQFKWIADFQYYDVLKQYTFKTYFDPIELPEDKSFVVKGVTNSRKHQWNTHCFAKTKRDAIIIGCELKNDGLISTQQIIYREYEKLKQIDELVNGMPVANEFRFFYYKNKLLENAPYWVNCDKIDQFSMDKDGLEFAQKIADKVCQYNNFYTIDIAQKQNDEWILVELNSGEMSGLCGCDPANLYKNLRKEIN